MSEDVWEQLNIGSYRTCSHCGSLHPDEFMGRIVMGEELTLTDKDYRADIGDDKFIFMHLDDAQRDQFINIWNGGTLRLKLPSDGVYKLPYFCKKKG